MTQDSSPDAILQSSPSRRVWEIDHIKPVAAFDLTQPQHQLACFHYTNCQPLLCFQNRSKGARFGS